MQQGLDSAQVRREIAETIRFQQSLLKLGSIGQQTSPKKPAARHAEPQERQLAAWADQLVAVRATG